MLKNKINQYSEMFEEMDKDISSFMDILSSKGIRYNPNQSNGPYEYIKGSASQRLVYLYIIKQLLIN